ncbi:MAG: four helix bundle protein [Prevotella sp.]|nr:four helix bundle protein [Prevotella sp.]
MKTDSTVYILSKQFALRIIKLYKFLTEEKHEYIMSKQIYRSGTSIGANFAERKFASSRADYLNKMRIALKEANETLYWLELLKDADYIKIKEFESLSNDLKTIIGTTVNIINKVKENYKIIITQIESRE